MTDDFGPLRQAMSDLAEHGGTTDMYGRSLRKSRQSQRRAAIITGVSAAAVVFAIGGGVAVTTAGRPVTPPPPLASQAPAPSVAPSSAAPSTTPSPSPPSAPRTTPPSSPPSSTRTVDRPQYPDCPSAKALEELVDLPKGWHFVESSVECWRVWATADPQGPTAGDGIYLFRYKAGTGWRYHSQGSGYDCKDLGITSGNPPFCQTP